MKLSTFVDSVVAMVNEALPPTVRLHTTEAAVQVCVSSECWTEIDLTQIVTRADDSSYLLFARQLLSTVQDVIAESTGEPWPLTAPLLGRPVPMPQAAIERTTLLMWFGSREEPVLRLGGLSLEDVRD